MKAATAMVLLVWRSGRSGVALASHRNGFVGKVSEVGGGASVSGTDVGGGRRPRRRSSTTTPACFAGRRGATTASPLGGRASRPFLAAAPANPAASSLSASLRDILERSGDETSPPAPKPTPATLAQTTTASNDVAVDEGGGRGGMMKGPISAAPLITTIAGRTITTSTPKTPPAKKSHAIPIVSISDAYDSGNGELSGLRLVDGEEDYCDVHVYVKIRPDPFTYLENKRHFQYFSFRSTLNPDSPAMRGLYSNKKSIKVKYIIQNAGEASYADAFGGYSTFVTTRTTPFDPDSWTRVGDATYEGGRLSWTHVHDLGEDGSATAYFAYFPPYSQERHLKLIAKCAEAEGATVKSLGQTVEGREIDCVTVGAGPRTCWIIHRQHPGESMAEFYAEGLLTRLLGLNDDEGPPDEVARKARESYTFHIVPNINPDGSGRGYLRTNAAGQNLNREWCPSPAPSADGGAGDGAEPETYEAPTLERSPEVYHLLRSMDETGCNAFLDVHGDEALPFNFLAGSEGMPVWGKRLESLHGAFLASYGRANGDMQAKVSYDPDEPGGGMPNICSNQIGQRFDCLSGTLEMPFKELHGGGGGRTGGWGPDRARGLGGSVLDALCYVSPYLRDGGEFWEGLLEEDAYVRPSSEY